MNRHNTIFLHNQTECTYTQVSNTFIDEYMPDANGTYVKVYLTLLRLVGDSQFNISIENIAEALDLTQRHVTKALNYWEKKELLVLARDDRGNIKDIIFNMPSRSHCNSLTGESVNTLTDNMSSNTPEAAPDNTTGISSGTMSAAYAGNIAGTPDEIKTYSAAELNMITSRDDFSWIVNILEKYMQRVLTPTDIDVVVYLYDSLHFSPDLIFYLYEYCIGKGKKNSKYIQAVALNWAREGIDTVEKATAGITEYDNRYMDVMRTFGLNQAPAPVQKKYIDTWLSYGYDISMIKEACSRTVAAIGTANFKYANGIIEKWAAQGIKNPDDIKIADNIHSESMKNKTHSKNKTTNTFNSYEQRTYTCDDYSSLERQLLNK